MGKQTYKYAPGLEYSTRSAFLNPDNCAVIERTADGKSVGPCLFYLEKGTTCPRHGVVKVCESQSPKK